MDKDKPAQKPLPQEACQARQANYAISPDLLGRWSPRAMTGEEVPDDDLFAMLEAARWAPSSYNNQPWRFIMARRRDKETFGRFFSFLNEGNQAWCETAGALLLVVSAKNFEYNGKPTATSAFDAGSAWENMAIEGTRRGHVVHAMEGFDKARAREACQVPEDFHVHVMIAVGVYAPDESLPGSETPSDRRPLSEVVMNGTFGEQFPELDGK